ncbi:ABC transporter ATP-binding protein [Kiloniella sp. b19]|uniref:ABC transporter ATP-binding protein n=1 Tax=Kiloniella sp. GXU_MW_B19 TaxID=3141326 RepID=UPI0031DF71CF
MADQIILEVEGLSVDFETPEGPVTAVRDLHFRVHAGEALGVVGESGSGKSQTFLSIMGLLASNGTVRGSARLLGQELVGLDVKSLNRIRGESMSMIFQDPMTSLNPYLKVSRQLTEVLELHKGFSKEQARRTALEMLERVGIPEASKRFDMYPHEFSGGMRQRVMIAMALLCEPALLIADEPTTALDVTVQAQILDLIRQIKDDFGTAVVMITHDLGVIANICDRVNVMYGGRVVEQAPILSLFDDPRHPYSQGLLASSPSMENSVEEGYELVTIPGQPPNLQRLPKGCSFAPRCNHVKQRCLLDQPPDFMLEGNRMSACFRESAS